ncbi:CoB--CoM heterodisulfide reductase iron-sulfur subunit B family protein [Dehalogenimonas etheniformans]|uniref:Heterodisulfide reductase subunit B n=1 Tax=Dehalogenimonas etheniformans TaxID=1536648 RepID=A0A2P5P9E8_9CHLR|nr:CoB--CoM heterodisulfide reductase iron-sulfur subunit B family protein [Dehalogenimonas etheniformans]PPD58904.1 heterodisulfide reductase subunit B [Dehalogenimonas etheniformans]QNT76330.1 CoB--CoM heterodisulfide reductase iron-sulfur subunit B family protein [Dehalogenimonas etheniformans]
MRYAYFNSCSLRASGKEYSQSLLRLFKLIGIETEELKNWMCCGSTLAHNTSVMLADTLPLKNLAEVQRAGFNDMVVPCTACYNRFKVAQYEDQGDRRLKREIEEIIGHKFEHPVSVVHPLEILSSEQNLAKLKSMVKRDMSHVTVAAYYGCLLVRPHKETAFRDNPEYPITMDRILNAVGIKTVDWSHKVECCGGSLSLTRPDAVLKLTSHILDNARDSGATAVSVPCTFCQLNLDIRQNDLNKLGRNYDMPIFYFTELLSLALGVPEKELMLNKHFVETESLLVKHSG